MLRVAVRVTAHQFAQHLKTFQRNWPKGFVQDPLRVFHDPGKDPLAQIAFQVFNMTSRPDAVLLVIVQHPNIFHQLVHTIGVVLSSGFKHAPFQWLVLVQTSIHFRCCRLQLCFLGQNPQTRIHIVHSPLTGRCPSIQKTGYIPQKTSLGHLAALD